MTSTAQASAWFVAQVTDQLAHPPAIPTAPPQSLDTGALGAALFHTVRANHDAVSAHRAHAWLRAATVNGVDASHRAGLFYGLPALVLVMSLFPGHYANARHALTRHLNALAHQRVDEALARMGSGTFATFGEYDLITGLTGIGAVLLRTDPHGSALERALAYLVRLTEPVRVAGEKLPGWWVDHAPWHNAVPTWKGGHANLGMAHGIGGVLALLALACRKGVRVPRQEEAISRVCAYMDGWNLQQGNGTWWPAWVTRQEHALGPESRRVKERRMSWCYGTPGLARAHQLVGLALDDASRRSRAEQAMAVCLEPEMVDQVADAGVCHGLAGLVQTARRMAQEQGPAVDLNPGLAYATEVLEWSLSDVEADQRGLFEGKLGAAMVLATGGEHLETPSWDACLLLTS